MEGARASQGTHSQSAAIVEDHRLGTRSGERAGRAPAIPGVASIHGQIFDPVAAVESTRFGCASDMQKSSEYGPGLVKFRSNNYLEYKIVD